MVTNNNDHPGAQEKAGDTWSELEDLKVLISPGFVHSSQHCLPGLIVFRYRTSFHIDTISSSSGSALSLLPAILRIYLSLLSIHYHAFSATTALSPSEALRYGPCLLPSSWHAICILTIPPFLRSRSWLLLRHFQVPLSPGSHPVASRPPKFPKQIPKGIRLT